MLPYVKKNSRGLLPYNHYIISHHLRFIYYQIQMNNLSLYRKTGRISCKTLHEDEIQLDSNFNLILLNLW